MFVKEVGKKGLRWSNKEVGLANDRKRCRTDRFPGEAGEPGFTLARVFRYFITLDGTRIGAARIVCVEETKRARISPMFIVPKHQGRGYGKEAICLLEGKTDVRAWEPDTILQEERSCHLYEKMGYRRTGPGKAIKGPAGIRQFVT
jgi:GNAT superfamily N-acetyltransferase